MAFVGAPSRVKSILQNKTVLLGVVIFIVASGLIFFVVVRSKTEVRPSPEGATRFNLDMSEKINGDTPYEQIDGSISNAEQAKSVGNLYIGVQKYTDAEKAFQKAVQLNSDNAELYSLLALTQERQGKKPEAKLNYQKAADLYKKAGDSVAQERALFRIKDMDVEYKNVLDIE